MSHLSAQQPENATKRFGRGFLFSLCAMSLIGAASQLLSYATSTSNLERLSFATVAFVHAAGTTVLGVKPEALDPRAPQVLLIDRTFFENEYEEVRPLSRAVTATLLEHVFTKSPKLVVLDLDVSPVRRQSTRELVEQRTLDSVIRNVPKGTTLVLAAPFPMSSEAAAAQNADWLRSHCNVPRLAFAYTFKIAQDGLINKFHPGFPSLGVVAATSHIADRGQQIPAEFVSVLPCELARSSHSPAFLDHVLAQRWLFDVTANMQIQEIAPRYFDAVLENAHVLSSLASVQKLPLGSSVYIGTNWNSEDKFMTPIGDLPGVMAHAAAHRLLLSPPRNVPAWIPSLVELGIGGLCAAFVGFALVGFNARVRSAMHRFSLISHYFTETDFLSRLTDWRLRFCDCLRNVAFWRDCIACFTLLLAIPFVFGAGIALIVFVSAMLLGFSIWLNPALLAIAVLMEIMKVVSEEKGRSSVNNDLSSF
jgi:hypothetical protein